MSQPLSPDPLLDAAVHVGPWTPLRRPTFRMLWGVWVVANACMWMHDVAAAWLMTSLSPSPVMVSLVQSASALPVFLLGLPSGAWADILNRRRYFMFTQIWVAVVALLICAVVAAGAMTAPLLLALTAANGVGLAMRWPVFAAIVPELVPRAELPSALALNGIAGNVPRIVGPLVAGAIIASAGSAYVFALNALLSVGAALVIRLWKHEPKVSALPGERFIGAMRVGVQYVWQSRRMHAILLRVSLFFVQSTALLGLLPLVARQLHGGDAHTFTLLLASMGAGAIAAAVLSPRIRRAVDARSLSSYGVGIVAVSMGVVSVAPNVLVAAPAMVVFGGAWLLVASVMMLSAQVALPDWVRARGMSIFQMTLMGSIAAGAAFWGLVATWTDVRTSLVGAAICTVIGAFLAPRLLPSPEVSEDLTPTELTLPADIEVDLDPRAGPVLVTIEYVIAVEHADAFLQVMQESRRNRLLHGMLSWGLFRDVSDPRRYVEHFVNETWVDHLRHLERMSAFDVSLRERRLSFHVEASPPKVSRYIAQSIRQ